MSWGCNAYCTTNIKHGAVTTNVKRICRTNSELSASISWCPQNKADLSWRVPGEMMCITKSEAGQVFNAKGAICVRPCVQMVTDPVRYSWDPYLNIFQHQTIRCIKLWLRLFLFNFFFIIFFYPCRAVGSLHMLLGLVRDISVMHCWWPSKHQWSVEYDTSWGPACQNQALISFFRPFVLTLAFSHATQVIGIDPTGRKQNQGLGY